DPETREPERPAAPGAAPPPAPLLDEEPETQVPGSFLESLPQFFVFPAILVATLTAAYFGLRLLVGSQPADARELIAQIRAADGEHGQWQSLHALADGLRTGRLDLEGVAPAELAALYREVGSQGSQQRQFLLEVLGWTKDPQLTGLAVEALGDEEPEVRMAALFALARMEDPAAVPALAERLGGGSGSGGEAEERWVALGALARIGTPAALDAIAGQLGGGDSVLHRNAVLALAQAGDGRAWPWLPALLDRSAYAGDGRLDGAESALRDEASRAAARESVVEQFLVSACRAAAHSDDPALRPLLQSLGSNDPSLKVRSAAISALADLGAPPESS
ncbi:MAG TPA: HEAT repeat domain-containing protein, partial [Planctomycetota bacterium]|nr:HEAT repeat domain-containing protein [Planctomycetota bacterium]